jgi:hypothetical protein
MVSPSNGRGNPPAVISWKCGGEASPKRKRCPERRRAGPIRSKQIAFPHRDFVHATDGWAVAFSALGLSIAAGCSPLRRRTWDRVEAFMGAAKSPAALYRRGVVLFVCVVVVVAAIAVAIKVVWPLLAGWLTQDGQPIVWLDGTSVWPTVFLRAAALILRVLLLIHGYWCLNTNMETIANDLLLVEKQSGKKPKTITQPVEEAEAHEKPEQYARTGKEQPWIRFASHFWCRIPSDDGPVLCNGKRLANDIDRFWRGYIYQGYLRARTYRVFAGLVGLTILWSILYSVVGIPAPPVRGNVSWWAYYSVTLALGFLASALIVFVADTTLLCWRLIEALRDERFHGKNSIWPNTSLQEFNKRFGLPKADIDEWIDLVFISKRTKCITPLIYAPFLTIALLLVSGSRLFANYGVNIPDLVTMGVGVLIVTACAVALRWSAEASRAKARLLIVSRPSPKTCEKGRSGAPWFLCPACGCGRGARTSPYCDRPSTRYERNVPYLSPMAWALF